MNVPRPRSALVLLLLGALTACSDQGPELPGLLELERNARLWSRTRPANYEYAVERLCFCGTEARGPVHVSVEANQVLDRTYVGTGNPVPATLAPLFPDVDGLFDLLREAILEGAHEIRVTYDPGTGVPVDFWIDYRANVADEELGMRVTERVEAAGALL